MGYCNSSAQFNRDSEFLSPHHGVVESDSSLGPGKLADHGKHDNNSRSVSAVLLLVFLQAYKILLSPFLGGACKYHPSCSNYASQAVEIHGARRGALLALKRLLRCRPFKPGGYDPVPSVDELNQERLRSTELEPLR